MLCAENPERVPTPELHEPSVWAGIDWGTHSSKWAFLPSPEESVPVAGPIRSSLLAADGETLTFCPNPDIPRTHSVARSVKRLIIDDPFGAFWEGEREDTWTSLGEAVAFSLCCLLGDLRAELVKGNPGVSHYDFVDIGFSLPNWVQEDDPKQRAALRHFHQAVMVAMELFTNIAPGNLPTPGRPYPIARWREATQLAIRKRREEHPDEWGRGAGGISVGSLIRKDLYNFASARCGYIVESCAAGLPYLRAMGDPAMDDSRPIRKILVVDVGAGSTDIGYMLRTISGGTWVLNYFTPGNTRGLAGDALTEGILDHFRQEGKPISIEQAQAEKENGTIWQDWQVTRDWKAGIARHVAEYIAAVPDTLRLPQEPPLEIIVTGGSGPSVPGLAELIQSEVKRALRVRGVGPVAERTVIADVVLPEYGLGDVITYARRIVSLGAADREKPRLSHKEKLEKLGPPVEIQTWRGSGG